MAHTHTTAFVGGGGNSRQTKRGNIFVSFLPEQTYAQDFLKSMASTANWVYGMIDKRETDPGVGEWMGWIGGMMEYFWAAHVETDDTNSPAARGVFRYVHNHTWRFFPLLQLWLVNIFCGKWSPGHAFR